MKKALALVLSLMMLMLAFTACSDKDKGKNSLTKTETTQKSEEQNDKTENAETAQPDKSYETKNGESTEMSEFEALVDTFNNSDDEAEKEKARIELEKILEQAEKQAQ